MGQVEPYHGPDFMPGMSYFFQFKKLPGIVLNRPHHDKGQLVSLAFNLS